MFPLRAASSTESQAALQLPAMHYRYTHPFAPAAPLGPHPNPVYVQHRAGACNYFDAARFVCERKPVLLQAQPTGQPRYLDAERERQVTRWLLEANEALAQHERNAARKQNGKNKKHFLRRFHSQDSNKNALREPWIENFILADGSSGKKAAPRVPTPVRQGSETCGVGASREPSPLSTADRSGAGQGTGTGSTVYSLREFCAQHSLPRVVRLCGGDEERPVLLYRLIERHRAVEALRLSGKKGKVVGAPIMIPDAYNGWFSLSSSRGVALAVRRASVAQLVRARAQTAVSDRPLSAYRPRQDKADAVGGGQYERTTAKSGEALRLTAVFADGSKPKAPKYVQMIDCNSQEYFVPINTKGDLYEACYAETICADYPQHPQLDSTSPLTPSPEDLQRVHRLTHLLSLVRLPQRVRLVSGTVPANMANNFNDDLLLKAVITEPVVVMYPLPDIPSTPGSPVRTSPDGNKKSLKIPTKPTECLQLVPLSTNIKLARTQLGYDSEKRMFLSSKLHRALTFCQYNFDTWIKQLYYSPEVSQSDRHKTAEELLCTEGTQAREEISGPKFEKDRRFTLQGLKIDPTRLFGKVEKAHKDMPDENEGSIIFLSKNELEHMNYEVYSDTEDHKEESKVNMSQDNQEQKQFADEKMKVFREDSAHPKRNKWFKHLKLLRSTEKLMKDKLLALENQCNDIRDPFDPESDKHRSIERYQDMAKLIEDKFGNCRRGDAVSDKCHSYKSLASSSDIGYDQDKKKVLTKSVSVQTGTMNTSLSEEIKSNKPHYRKNLSVDQINYYGSESSSSIDRKMVSLDGNIGNKPVLSLEKRQRIQPDLIPSGTDGINFDQIQSCEELNVFSNTNQDHENVELNLTQNSFITEKLCSEFHVKTKKVLSKSTSNLFHTKKSPDPKSEKENSNSMPTTTEKKNQDAKLITKQQHSSAGNLNQTSLSEVPSKVKRSISSIQNRKLPVIEDLPYGQVADAVGSIEEGPDSEILDNIYAEICNPTKTEPLLDVPFDDNIMYDFGSDILANDPVISNVKQEIKIRNEERTKMAENNDNSFRHIEVVVIERNASDLQNLDGNSTTSSDDDYNGFNPFRGDYSEDSWEKPKKSSIESDDKNNHAIRLEITNPVDYRSSDVNSTNAEVNHSSTYVHLEATSNDRTEAIYNTLKSRSRSRGDVTE